MFRLFKRDSGAKAHQRISGLQNFRQELWSKTLKYQHAVADFLSTQISGWRPCRLKISLFLFCLLATISSVTVVVSAIRHPPDVSLTVTPVTTKIQRIRENAVSKRYISKEEYDHLEQFRKYLDSIGHTVNGKHTKDSMLARWPGLMDSLEMVEQFYNNQKKEE